MFKGEVRLDQTLQIFEPGYYEKEDEYYTIEGYNLLNEANKLDYVDASNNQIDKG